ncbi:PTS galactitol transporter subunit IIC [Enterococcus faecalis]|uniref:PTS galactitol transporter subunit IIC n=1 Tax=Enterococcus faecalis TaxID=1351 RepID=UPI0011417077|nr:PTS transporter subunit IIC [Enterococcus faecalis]EGO9400060.1 PTS galactitol transporter subunit IIC [Enterococcus faecalis]EGO9465966.1 PTS galactitol transporter subunit IIC [Enterococcus faecalis]EHZ5160244.1 PTS galactitol transporter subunit IIC [Enterococcus faecalis]EKZ0210702.1 PTS galactitol transporter subunit IIC [Enterococcus faecalis]ELS0455742.1 PTS galactitol transporter subunit IIC [Enterococcus faecalis]
MNIVMDIFNFFIDAGPTVMLPVIITIIGLIFGLKITRAFKSGLTLGIGFAGIKLILDFMTTNVGPAAKAMVDRTGVKLDALDVGWGSIAAVTWASPIIPILIFSILIINIVLLILKKTHTLDVDIWNYHHMAIVGVMVYFVTKNVFLGVGASVVMAIVTFKMSDWSQPMVEDFFGIPGVSLPTVSALSSLVIAWPLNWLLDRIPLFKKSTFTIKDAQKYLGFFGDSMIMGLIIGIVIGILAGYDVKAVLQLGVSMSAVLVLIPKMTALFMEGLMPISDAAQKWSQKKFKGRKLFIGLDAAVVVGNPDVITTALIIIPLTIAMALVLPGNRVLPFADLAVVPFRVAMVVALTRGNLLKNIVIGLVVTASLLWCGSATSPILTAIAKSVGIKLGATSMLISSFAATAMLQSYLVFIAFAYKPIIGIPVFIVAFLIIWYYFERIKNVNQEMSAVEA